MVMGGFLSSELPSIVPGIVFSLGDFKITQTMISASITVAVLILAALIIRLFFIPRWKKNLKKVSGFQLFIEWFVNMLNKTSHDTIGHNSNIMGPWYFAIAAFIAIGTLMEMTGLRPPTSDLNVALALGLLTFLWINILGAKEKKLKRLLRYANPINIITDAVVPVSMALRMFGSVFSGFLIMHLIYSIAGFLPVGLLDIGLPIIGNLMFTVFHAVIQSYIFMVLSLNFIAEATE